MPNFPTRELLKLSNPTIIGLTSEEIERHYQNVRQALIKSNNNNEKLINKCAELVEKINKLELELEDARDKMEQIANYTDLLQINSEKAYSYHEAMLEIKSFLDQMHKLNRLP